MEGDLIGSYSELGSEEVVLDEHYESDEGVLSDLSSIKTYSQGDYGEEEELHGMINIATIGSLCRTRIRQQSILEK
jgi:hypothetical protein